MPIDRNGGQYITANPQQPTQSSAPGIWDIDEQGSAQAAGRWPLPPNVVQRSLRFNSADSAYLSRTPATASNRKTWTWSGWVKLSAFSAARRLFSARVGLTGDQTFIQAASDNTLLIGGNSGGYELRTTAVYRDPSAWYHIVLAFDTTQATSSNRIQLYVNGSQVTALQTATYPSLNLDTFVNATNPHSLGAETGVPSEFLNGYMAEVNFVDGQALTPSSFGQTDAQTGQWIPRVYSGSYGTNGFRLQFLDNSGTTATTLGKDTSGMGNNWTPNNFSVAAGSGNDSLRDVPMNYYSPDNGLGGEVIGNYATWNPLDRSSVGGTTADGNLSYTNSNAGAQAIVRATIAVTSGKWYWETTVQAFGGSNPDTGIVASSQNMNSADQYVGNLALGYSYAGNGQKRNNNTGTAYGSTYTTGDIIGVALDMDAGTLTFYKNGVSQGQAFSGLTVAYAPAVSCYNNGIWYGNFGQRPFAYTAPSGFKALCTQNFSAPRIGNVAVAQANDYFNTVLYTGTGSSLSVTGTGFQPDLVWIKSISAATDHALYDAVRGVQKQLESDTTTDETTETTGLTAFDADGFTVGALAQVNTNTATYAAWQWKESDVSGFDIVTYTGNGSNRTIAHNLGVAPSLLIVKARTTASTDQGWPLWHTSIANTNYLLLNSTAASTSGTTYWNSTSPTSSVFSVGTNAAVNANNDTYVAYLFAAVPGFSAFGSYTGNSSTDGPFVYLGFRPRWILIKLAVGTSATSNNWFILDTARDPQNVEQKYLMPSLPDGQGTTIFWDGLSNGFKVRNSITAMNESNSTYIYAAFAEIPFQFANAR